MRHVTLDIQAAIAIESDDITAAMRDARRNVAIAKLSQFETECLMLGGMIQRNPRRKQEVVDCLYDIATANNLLSDHGGGLVEELIAAGLGFGA
ncbi:hypothetical protein [Bradyrhizobium sp. BWC-3-1]|uniref:hypothetical protein n=1 Tax=Bradyrhizobium sp. BWC-3-1 TaxID=3080012 RepID=UPI00293F70E5|nr:hypothetical protein [Bradyrhizobium sp. BWC-3-1]WOH55043.1 hypothetical protein RX329_22215 [Bradyrhizobium sp. BWC-3-1]